MAGKIIKGLSCLGGVGALSVGGVYLKSHIDRKNFLRDTDEKAKILETAFNDGVYLFKSNTEEELVKRLWVGEVVREKTWNKGTREELRDLEKKTWEKITRSDSGVGYYRHINIKKEEVEKIEAGHTEYWKRYWEACLTWNLNRNNDTVNANNGAICLVSMSLEEYRGYDEYKEYEKLKNKGLNMDIKEYYWTIWKRFRKDKGSEIKKEDQNDSNVPTLFESWMKEDKNKSLFTNAGITDL